MHLKEVRSNKSGTAGGQGTGGFGTGPVSAWTDGLSAPGYPGMLPTLGLTKYKNVDLATDKRNPFRVHDHTEQLLVVREREREFRDFNKLEKEGLRVFEKEKASKPSRRGVIKEIRNIQS